MARKFIITDDRIIFGNVNYHSELIPRMADFNKPILGGGLWDTDDDKKILYMWGASTDYGYAEPEKITQAFNGPETYISPFLAGYQVMHAEEVTLTLPPLETFNPLLILPLE